MPGTAVINRVEKHCVSGTLNLKKLPEVADSMQCKVFVVLLVPAQNTLCARLSRWNDCKKFGVPWCKKCQGCSDFSFAGKSNTIINGECLKGNLHYLLTTQDMAYWVQRKHNTLVRMKHNDWRDVYMRIIITVVQNKDLALPTLTVFARILSLPMIVVNPFEHLSLHRTRHHLNYRVHAYKKVTLSTKRPWLIILIPRSVVVPSRCYP